MAIDVEETYRRYGPMVLRRCRRLLHDEALAIDTMHDVFVNLLIHHKRLEDRGVSSLLYRIATNLSLNKIRSRARHPEDPSTEVLMKIADATRTEEITHARSLLSRALGKEPVSTATIAVLHLHDGLTLQEVADTVGLSVSGVRKRLRKLKGLLVELEAADRRGEQGAQNTGEAA